MNPNLYSHLARTRTDELLREAVRRRTVALAVARRSLPATIAQAIRRVRASTGTPPRLEPDRGAVCIRCAQAEDETALLHLAALDSATELEPPVLVAESSGALLAAVSLRDERAIADPFHRTAELVELLRVRAAQLAATNQQEVNGWRLQWLCPERSAPVRRRSADRFQNPRPVV